MQNQLIKNTSHDTGYLFSKGTGSNPLLIGTNFYNMKATPICGIYKITSPSGRVYIGQSIDCEKRKYRYRYGCPRQGKLHQSILKYGWEAHIFEIIHLCEECDLNRWEIYYSDLYDSRNKSTGLNLKECGGSKGKHSEETIIKCSFVKKGKKNTPEHKKNTGIALKKLYDAGKLVVWNKGLTGVQKCSEETREKRRKSMLGKNTSEAFKEATKLKWKKTKESLEWNSPEAAQARTEFIKKCWEKRKLNGNDKPSKETSEKRRKTMLKTIEAKKAKQND